MATRTRLGPAVRRQQLLDVGLAMVSDGTVHGLDDLRMEDVAARAGVSKALLFHYFPTTRGFAVAVAQEAADNLFTRTEVPPGGDLLAGLEAGIAAFVEYVESRRMAYVGLVRGTASSDPAMRAVYEHTRDRIAQRTLATIAEAGLPTDDAAALAVRGWQAFVEEAVLAWLDDPRITRQRLIHLLGQSFIAVLGSSQSEP